MDERSSYEKPPLADEIWFREDEQSLLETRTITATGRLGDRTAETVDPKGGYQVGRPVVIKIQRADKSFASEEIIVVPNSVVKKTAREIKPEDLQGTSFESRTPNEFIQKLASIYGREISGNEMISIVHFEYKNDRE